MPEQEAPESEETQETEEVLEESTLEVEETGEETGEETAEKKPKSDPRIDQLLADHEKTKKELARISQRNQELEETVSSSRPAPQNAESKTPNIDNFSQKLLPEARRVWNAEGATNDKRFETMVQTADNLVGAVMRDRIAPAILSVHEKTISLSIDNQILQLKLSDKEKDSEDDSPKFSEYESDIRKQLKGMSSDQKDKEGIVRELFLRAIGSNVGKKKKESTSTVRDQIRDVAAGTGSNGSAGRKVTTKLTPAQEQDRQEISEAFGYELAPEKYMSQLEARRKIAKAKGANIPETLRDY